MNQYAVPPGRLVTLLLGGMIFFLPSLLRADSITLAIPPGPANPVDSFSFGVNSTITFALPTSVFVNDLQNDLELGKPISTMIFTDTHNGVTLQITLTNDFVTSIAGGGTSPTIDVSVKYLKLTTTTIPTPTPEPSSLILLGTGLFGLMGLRRLAKKFEHLSKKQDNN